MSQLLSVLVVLVCPLMMIFMMRGMSGGHGKSEPERHGGPRVVDTTAQGARIGELEREVARLRATRASGEGPDPAFVDELHGRPGRRLTD